MQGELHKLITMKKIFVLLALGLGVMSAQAQITTGESSSKVIRTGNRAQAGNFGLYIGATTDMFRNLSNGGPEEFSCLPLINLKYMKTDNLEYRLGFEWWKSSTTTETDYGYNGAYGSKSEVTDAQSMYMFYPGAAYHFSKQNLLDVYVGVELPFGFSSASYEVKGGADESASHFRMGVGAFIGLQAYVGNLPLALGMEYGISSMYSTVSDGHLSKDGMTVDFNGPRKGNDESRWELGHQVRFTLSYYFNL